MKRSSSAWPGWFAIALGLQLWAALAHADRVAVLALGDCEDGQSAGYASLLARSIPPDRAEVLANQELAAALLAPTPAQLRPIEARLARAELALQRDLYDQAKKEASQVLAELERLGPSEQAWPVRQRASAVQEAIQAQARPGPKTPAGAASSATLRVDSEQPGVAVYVDARPVGRTPLAVELPVGLHQVEDSGCSPLGLPRRVALPTSGATVRVGPSARAQLYLGKGACLRLEGGPEAHRQELADLAQALHVEALVLVRFESRTERKLPYLTAERISREDGSVLVGGSLLLSHQATLDQDLAGLGRLVSFR